MQKGSSISELLNSLDATTYFFVSSGIFIAVSAVLYFGLGMWLGQILWGRFKKRFRQSEEMIEAYKGEVALLKRRIAEQATRPAPGTGPSPLQAIAFKATTSTTIPPVAKEVVPVQISARALVPFPPGKPFTIWTEPGWHPHRYRMKKLPPGRGFTIWGESTGKPGKVGTLAEVSFLRHENPLFTPDEILIVPRSRAFSVWTEKTWTPPTIKTVTLLPAAGFSVWTLPGFEPSARGPHRLSFAHTLWTLPDWSPPRRELAPPMRSSRAFTVWTELDWPASVKLPRSGAFSIWTEPGWTPERLTPTPLPASAAWSLWTSPDYESPGYGRLPASRAFSIWTEEGWTPTPVRPLPHVAPPAVPAASASSPQKRASLVARAFAAARQALGIDELVSPTPSAPLDQTPSPSSQAPALSPPKATAAVSVPELLGHDSSPPPSRAFTLWTTSLDATPEAPAAKVAQSAALAALIESKTPGKVAPPATSARPSAPLPPGPEITGGSTPGQDNGVLRQQQLNLEPLIVPTGPAEPSR